MSKSGVVEMLSPISAEFRQKAGCRRSTHRGASVGLQQGYLALADEGAGRAHAQDEIARQAVARRSADRQAQVRDIQLVGTQSLRPPRLLALSQTLGFQRAAGDGHHRIAGDLHAIVTLRTVEVAQDQQGLRLVAGRQEARQGEFGDERGVHDHGIFALPSLTGDQATAMKRRRPGSALYSR